MEQHPLFNLLGQVLSQHLGIGVDYRAILRTDERAIDVEMISPEYLRGFRFVFREGEPLPPQIMVAHPGWTAFAPVPTELRYTYQGDHGQWIQVPGTVVENRIEGVGMPVTVSETIGGIANSAPTTVAPVVAQRRVTVRVYRREYGNWIIEVKVGGRDRDLPKAAVIKALLPPAEKHFVPNRQGRYRSTSRLLETALSAGLSAQSLHDALKAWVMVTETAPSHVESDTPLVDNSQLELLRAQPATLEVGGKVYRLVPCGEVDVRPLITRVRTRALATARVEGEAIKSRATTDARLVVSQAEASAQAIRRAIEAERSRMGNPVPEWVKISSREHRWDGTNWLVMLRISCKVDKIRLMVAQWETILYWNSLRPKNDEWYLSHKMPVWLRLHPEGVYTLNDVSMKGEWETTHIASYCCMELQGLPTAITTNDLAIRLENGLGRGMRIVNLNSPLGTQTFKYWPDFLAQIPPVPLRFLEQGRNSEHYINPGRVGIEAWRANNPSITWDSEESTRSEADGVFTVREVSDAQTR